MTKAVELAQVASTGVSEAFKNRIINGAMVIDQRNAGASFSSSANGAYNLDRWYNQNNSSGTRFTVQQNAGSVTPPAGFRNYLGVTSTSAYSVASTDVIAIGQKIEGFNTADLMWGTANAQTITLSFWVRSSLTGTFGGSVSNNDGNRFYAFSYTISAANTWEQKSVTVAGDTTGTWLTNNAVGIQLLFNLGTGATFSGTAGSWTGSPFYAPTGAVSVVGTNGATFYITGVQLEVGTSATNFEYRPYGTELLLCQRYFQQVAGGFDFPAFAMWNVTPNATSNNIILPNTMRAQPTGTVFGTPVNVSGGSVGTNTWALYNNSGWRGCTFVGFSTIGTTTARIDAAPNDSVTAGGASGLYGGTQCYLTFSAEL